MGCGRSSRSSGKSRSRPRNARPGRRRALRQRRHSGPVRQRLRWIPPGRFLMGSPPDEEGRYSDEGPQHEVTIAEGFWMFDTPCTQALWEALMGENPSEFKSADRPVESVTWDRLPGVCSATRREGRALALASVGSPVGVRLPRGDDDRDLRRPAGDQGSNNARSFTKSPGTAGTAGSILS